VDYKFWSTFAVNVVGLAFMAWQIQLMKQQIGDLPSSRSTRRLSLERKLSRRLYVPVVVMAGLVLLSWLPYVLANRPSDVLPNLMVAWGGGEKGCSAVVDTSGIVQVKEKYRLFAVCRINDPTIDPLEDEHIAISKPFNITGGIVQIVILYNPSSAIATMAKPGTSTAELLVLLPSDQDGSRIKRMSDITKEGGQILTTGGRLKK
jgi:hypothetical protein